MENKKTIVIQEVPYKVMKEYFDERKRERINESLKAIEDYKRFKGD